MKIKNKRGDIPIIILVLGVLAVCSLALLSFYNATLKVSNDFSGIKLIEKVNSQIEINKYQGKAEEKKYEFKEVRRPTLLKPLNKEIIFSVEYNPPS